MAKKYKLLNGKHIELVGAELAEHEEALRLGDISTATLREAELVKEANKASGKSKLKALGLDDEEIKALTGA